MAEDIRHLAQRLKGLREVLEIPIEQMAQVCETSVEHYLKMESGEADPGVYRLSRVAKKFGISLDILLFGEEPRMVGYFVTRKGQSTQVEMRNDYKYEGLASGFKDRKVEPFFTTIDPLPEGKNRSKNCHDGQEWDYVLSGVLEITIGEKVIVLYPGDCIYFDASNPHCMRAINNARVEFLTVII